MINKLQLPFECQQFDSELLNGLSESTVIPINNIIAFALCTQGSVTVDIDDAMFSFCHPRFTLKSIMSALI